MDSKTIKVRHGIPMTEEELKEWQDAFLIIELAINNLMGYNEKQGGGK